MTDRYAIIDGGIVENIVVAGPGFAIEGKTVVPAGNANIRDLWDGETFTTLLPPLADLKAAELAALADERWKRTQTFSYDGEVGVPADPALSVITSLAVADQIAQSAPGYDADALRTFKLKSPAVFRQWTIEQIVAYGLAIGVHLQACFDREKALAADIQAAADHAALDAIDITADWP